MKTFNLIVSRIFRIFLIFMLFFIWVRFYEKNLTFALAYTAILTFAFDCLLNFIIKKRDTRANLKNSELKNAENYCNYFIFNNKQESVLFYSKLLSEQFPIIKKTDYIVFENDSEVCVLYPLYSYDKLKISDIITINNISKKTNCKKIIICASDYENGVREFATRLPIKIILLNKYESYEKLMKKFNYFPKETLNFATTKNQTFKNILAYSFNRKRAKGYIFASLVLILSSFFVKISIYYLIISSVLLLFAIFSYTNNIYNQKLPDNVL